MYRVDVLFELDPDYLMEENDKDLKATKNTPGKTIKIDNKLFKHALEEGLIEKTSDGYVFIGKYKDVEALKKKNHST